MKIRIKKTGQILLDVKYIDTTSDTIKIHYLDDDVLRDCSIKNLSDIEENESTEDTKESKEIGNYFETPEEAEQAVEKLKAWKRLKDKGFHWLWHTSTAAANDIDFYVSDWDNEATRDINLLFGGE